MRCCPSSDIRTMIMSLIEISSRSDMTRERFEGLVSKVDNAIYFALSSGLIDVDAYCGFSRDVEALRQKFCHHAESKPSAKKVSSDALIVYLNSHESERREFFKDFDFHFDAFTQAIGIWNNGHETIAGQDTREIIHSLKHRLYFRARQAFSSGLIRREEKDELMQCVRKVLGIRED